MSARKTGLFQRCLAIMPPDSTPIWGWMSVTMIRHMGESLRDDKSIYGALARLVLTGRARRIKCPVTGAWLYAKVVKRGRR